MARTKTTVKRTGRPVTKSDRAPNAGPLVARATMRVDALEARVRALESAINVRVERALFPPQAPRMPLKPGEVRLELPQAGGELEAAIRVVDLMTALEPVLDYVNSDRESGELTWADYEAIAKYAWKFGKAGTDTVEPRNRLR